jgi:hypothetical protein
MDALLDLLKDNLIIVLGGAVGGFLGLLVSWRELGKIFRMLRTPTGEIGSLPIDEQVEVVGKAESQTALQSPITKTPCVFWQVVVMEKRSSGKSSHWVVVQNRSSTAAFAVSDGTGRMTVHPSRGLELLLREDVKKSSGIFNSLDEQTQVVLSEMGVNTKGLLNLNRPLRVHERYIEQGDEIYLMGRTSANPAFKMLDGENFPLLISDHSELSLVGKFTGKVLVNALLGVFIGAIVAVYFMDKNIKLPWSN